MKFGDVYAVAIVPAKTDSTRLREKNLQQICGKTLLEHTLDYAYESKYLNEILVSTESAKVSELCKTYNEEIVVLDRPEHLLKDAEVADVYVDIFQNQLKAIGREDILEKATHVVALQPDHPDRNCNLDELIDYFVKNTYVDLVTVNSDGTRNGATRITKAEFVTTGMMSRRMGTYLDDCTNIHSEEDLRNAERNLVNKGE